MELLKQLEQWHRKCENEKIIEVLTQIPKTELTYDIVGILARAYNNFEEYDKAIRTLETVKEIGYKDSLWLFRLGYAQFYLELYDEALESFEQCRKLNPTEEDIDLFLSMTTYHRRQGTFSIDAWMKYFDCPFTLFGTSEKYDDIMTAFHEAYLRGKEEGFVPFLVAANDDTLFEWLTQEHLDNLGIEISEIRKKLLRSQLPNTFDVLNRLIDERKAEAKEDEVDWNTEIIGSIEGGRNKTNYVYLWDSYMRTTEPLLLIEIPVKNPWEVFVYVPFGGWNECPHTVELMAVAKHWFERYGAIPVSVTHDTLEFSCQTPVPKENALELALEQFGFCPDVLDQSDEETLGSLADTLSKSTVWSFWWD